MSYFGDLMDDAEKRMGAQEHDLDDEGNFFKPTAVKLLSGKIKSAPGKGVTLAQGADFVSKGEGKFDHKHKTEVKYNYTSEHTFETKVSNKDAEVGYEYQPADFNKDGFESSLAADYKRKPPNGAYEGKVELKCGGYELGGIKGWSELQLDFGAEANKAKKLENDSSLTHSQTLNHSDFWLAYRLTAGIQTKDLRNAAAALIWKNGDYDFWARGSLTRKIFGLGATYRMSKDTKISNEFLYDLGGHKKVKGIMGTPFFWRYGSTHNLKTYQFENKLWASNQELSLTEKLVLPIDSRCKLSLTWGMELSSWLTDPKKAYNSFKPGFNLELKV